MLTEPALREMFGVLRAVRSIEVNPAAFTPPATSLQDQVMAGAQESDEGGAQGVKGGAGARSVAGRGPRIGWENGVCWQDASGNCRLVPVAICLSALYLNAICIWHIMNSACISSRVVKNTAGAVYRAKQECHFTVIG